MDDSKLFKIYQTRGPKAKVPREELRRIVLDYAREKKDRLESFYLTNSLIEKLTGVTSHLMIMRVRAEVPLAIDGIIPIIDESRKINGKALFLSLNFEEYQTYKFSGKNFRYLTNEEVEEISRRIDNLNLKIETRIRYRILVVCDFTLQKSPRNIPQPYNLRNIAEALLDDPISVSMIIKIMEKAGILYITPNQKQYCLQNIRGKKYDPSSFALFSAKGKDSLKTSLSEFLNEESNEELKDILERLRKFTYKGKSSEINLATMLLYTLLEKEELYSPKIDMEKEAQLQKLEKENNVLKQQIIKLEKINNKVSQLESDTNILRTVSDELKKFKTEYNILLEKYNNVKPLINNLNQINNMLIDGFNKRLKMLTTNIVNETDNFMKNGDIMALRVNCITHANDTQRSLDVLVKTVLKNIREDN